MRYLIIGASAAGTSAAREIRRRDPSGEIVMLARDQAIFSRCQLHLVAAGRRTPTQACFLPASWAHSVGVDLRLGTEVTALDAVGKAVTLHSGERLSYDRLLIATGSRTALPPIPGLAGALTFGLRDLADAQAIQAAKDARDVVVIGAGLVGVEIATELAEQGRRVTLVELAPYPLPLQLESETGAMCRELLETAGIRLFCGDKVSGVERDARGNPLAVRLASGNAIPADLIVAAAGVRANAELAAAAGAKVNRGILIDSRCRTTLPDIYAAGDVTETEDVIVRRIMPSAIWPTAIRQGQVAGASMAGADDSLLHNTGMRASVNLLGTSTVSLGAVALAAEFGWTKRTFRHTDSRGRRCVKVFFLEGRRLRGAILWGDILNAGVYGEAILNDRDLSGDLAFIADLDGARRGTEVLHVS